MQFRPSDFPELPWWGWLVFSASTWGVCVICQSFADRDRSWFITLVAYLAGMAAIFSGSVGAVLWLRAG